MTKTYTWWKDATVYQIWPASFKDSNGDGTGDIPGIISKLDYVKSLGVDVVWLSPMYDSPQDDMGYDISDYNKVYPKYGTLEDMDTLIEGCHKRGLKLILDLVVNHTSSEHEWFKESRSSKTNPKRDWYIWKPPKYDKDGNRHPPNNWRSMFSGSAWEWDELTGEYYLRLFAASQPDLNWEVEECRKAIYKTALTFWYERGVDGFRIDTSGLYSKVQSFPDAKIVFPDEEFQPPDEWTRNGPRIHEFHKEMFAETTSKYDAMTVGEAGKCSREDALKYARASEKEMNMLFLFDLVAVGTYKGNRFRFEGYTLRDVKKAIESQCAFTRGTDAWSTVFIENHDVPRCVSRFGSSSSLENTFKSAKMLAMLQTSLSGTLFIYQGQEIAMTNIPRSWDISEYQDIETINAYNALMKSDPSPEKKAKFFDDVALLARDHARTPVQWDSSANGGFSTGKPWMRVNDNYKRINVQSQIEDSNSVLSFYKKSLQIRSQYKDLFIYGELEIFDIDNKHVFTYVKSHADAKEKAYVVLNFSDEVVPFEKLIEGDFRLISSNIEAESDELSPWEGRVYIVE